LQRSLMYPITSFMILVCTSLIVILFLNGVDIVEEKYFFPTIMIGYTLVIIFGIKIKSQKIKSIALWSIGVILLILFLAMMVTVFLWTSGNP
jgi:uncharacterized secreted protein with C-terminal beta-propeller domain